MKFCTACFLQFIGVLLCTGLLTEPVGFYLPVITQLVIRRSVLQLSPGIAEAIPDESCTTDSRTRAFNWGDSLKSGSQLEVCEGQSINFPWSFQLGARDRVNSYEFQRTINRSNGSHHGGGLHTEVLTKANQRFTFGPKRQLHTMSLKRHVQINSAIVNDTGNYSLTVDIVPGRRRGRQKYVSTVSLLVKARLRVAGDGLWARLEPRAVMVTNGPQPGLHMKLSCGTLTSLGHPPVKIVWTTPSGRFLPSTPDDNGTFSVIVPNPVDPGLYICKVQSTSPALACVDQRSALREARSVYVGGLESRVSMLETGSSQSEAKARDTNTYINQLNSSLSHVTSEISQSQIIIENLNNSLEEMRRENAKLRDEDNKLKFQMAELKNFSSSLEEIIRCQLMARDCLDIKERCRSDSGVHTLNVWGRHVAVYCDQETDGGGWTVIQRRENGVVDFYRGWDQYMKGFGITDSEYWLGLENIHQLTKEKNYQLRVDLWGFDNRTKYAHYKQFYLDGADKNYQLHVIGHKGTAGDSFTVHNNLYFTTFDKDNDPRSDTCAKESHGAWWYGFGNCYFSNLNGRYKTSPEVGQDGVVWLYYNGKLASLKKVEMKIRRKV